MKDMAPEPSWLDLLASLEGAYHPRTISSLGSHFRHFESWCHGRAHLALPAEPESIALYVTETLKTLTLTTVCGRLWSIARLHSLAGLANPTASAAVKLAMRRALRAGVRRRRPAAVIDADFVRRLQASCATSADGILDRLLLGIGYDALCRAGELVSIQAEEVTFLDGGGARILIAPIGGPQGAAPHVAFLRPSTAADVRRWMGVTGFVCGPLLRWPSGRVKGMPIRASAIRPRLRRVLRRAGCLPAEARGVTSSSMRLGASQDLAAAGVGLVALRQAGRWRRFERPAELLHEAHRDCRTGEDGDAYPLYREGRKWRLSRATASGSANGDDDRDPNA